MVINLVQKSGRTDDRDIDQFMDDVILSVKQIAEEIANIDQTIEIVVNSTFICRTIAEDVIIPPDKTLLQRNPVINDGVNVEIQETGEFFLL